MLATTSFPVVTMAEILVSSPESDFFDVVRKCGEMLKEPQGVTFQEGNSA